MRRRLVPVLMTLLALIAAGCSKDDKGFTEAKLQGYLLTDADVPDGFEKDAPEDEEDDPELPECLGGSEEVKPQAEASVDYSGPNAVQQISHTVEGHEEGKAEESMAEGRATAEKCATFQDTIDGTAVEGNVTEAEAPDVGDDAAAYAIRLKIGPITMEGELVAVRQGDIVSVVTVLNVGGPVDGAMVDDLVGKAVDRLPSA